MLALVSENQRKDLRMVVIPIGHARIFKVVVLHPEAEIPFSFAVKIKPPVSTGGFLVATRRARASALVLTSPLL
jgi:hypothetical protein